MNAHKAYCWERQIGKEEKTFLRKPLTAEDWLLMSDPIKRKEKEAKEAKEQKQKKKHRHHSSSSELATPGSRARFDGAATASDFSMRRSSRLSGAASSVGSRSLPSIISESRCSSIVPPSSAGSIHGKPVVLPPDLTPVARFDLTDSNLLTNRNKVSEDGLIPTLQFKPVKVPALWVPGCHYYVSYKPVFTLEKPDY